MNPSHHGLDRGRRESLRPSRNTSNPEACCRQLIDLLKGEAECAQEASTVPFELSLSDARYV